MSPNRFQVRLRNAHLGRKSLYSWSPGAAATQHQVELATAFPAKVTSFLKGFQSLAFRRAKALLQEMLRSATVYREGRIELAFRT